MDEWNKLPKNYQAILQTATAMANIDMQAKYDALNPTAIRSLVGKGVELRQFSPEILDACFKAANETYAEITAKNPAFKKIYDSLKAFRADAYLWNQLTDGTYDNFMMAQQRTGVL
jgi:TRAP-type mannitol/chloroaromatic compound transport system substrate-binding protein